MVRKVTFFLYRVTASKGTSVERDLFGPVLGINNLAQRHVETDGERVTLWDYSLDGRRILGQMFRGRTEGLDRFLANKVGGIRAIPLDQNVGEGLTGKTHFMYCPEHDILVLQGGDGRVGPGLMIRYLERLAKTKDVEIRPAITASQYQKFRRMKVISAVGISFERPDRGLPLADSGEPTGKLIEAVADIGALKAVIMLTRGSSRKRWLLADKAVPMIQNLLGLYKDEQLRMRSLAVRGAASIDDKLDEVDLIQDRMKFEKLVEYDQHGPTPGACYAACREAYAHFEGDIEEMYHTRNH